jgi:2-iminobutanoate/2-iminopropanoate deaminase
VPHRKSILVEGLAHASPIPSASRIGNLLISSAVFGADPATGLQAATLAAQCAHMFANVRRIVEAGGGKTDDIIKVTVWMVDPSQKQALNEEWTRLFPDAASRPARHTLRAPLEHGALIQCEFTAVVDA